MINLDNAAAYPVCQEVLDNIQEIAAKYYNPSSAYQLGTDNMIVIEEVRKKIASVINAEPEEIYFTSGSSEANSWAIDGFLKANDEYQCVSTTIEHSSILNNPNVHSLLSVDENGLLCPKQFDSLDNTLFAIGHANNEIGTIQDIKAISQACHISNNILFVDAAQSFMHVPIDVKAMGIDMLSATPQKIGGIRGCAFLYIRKGIRVSPIIYGTQENSLRGGTYNNLAIECFGIALDNCDTDKFQKINKLRTYLFFELINIGCLPNGGILHRLPNNVNIRLPKLKISGQQVIALLELKNIICSSGSACHAGDPMPSHVLKAIRLTDEECMRSIRITLSDDITKEDLQELINSLKLIIDMYK